MSIEVQWLYLLPEEGLLVSQVGVYRGAMATSPARRRVTGKSSRCL